MARDAIARQYDVDRNRMIYHCEDVPGGYKPGTITFTPKKGKTLDLRKIEESIRATRLSGNTSMSVTFFEITATGAAALDGQDLVFKVSGTGQQFVLKDADAKGDKKSALQRLRAAVAGGAQVVSV